MKVQPHLTEKSYLIANTENPVFTLRVDVKMNKMQIKDYLKSYFKVDVVDIKTVNKKAKQTKFRGIAGKKGQLKKAFVTLKKGQKIPELIVEKKDKKEKKTKKEAK